jgi:large subunit ribosomal protein L1
MATTKKTADVKAEEETRDEIAEVQEQSPEVELTADVAAGAESQNLAKPGSKEAKGTKSAGTEAGTPAEDTAEPEPVEQAIAKAGKRSAKSVREAEAEEARQEAKGHRAEEKAAEEAAPKRPKRQLPNPLHQHGKKYRAAAGQIEPGKAYPLSEALELVKNTSGTKFDGSVEMHINLGVDPRQADQMVRASVVLPHGTGKTIRVAVFADGKAAEAAKTAGADRVDTDKLLSDIEKGKLEFDMLIATPDKMATLGKVAKILGPRGLMPNPKSGTVTPDPAKAVTEAKAGKVEFRIDKQAIVHQIIGKVSFKPEQLEANATTLLSAILKAKPSAAKGTYVKGIATASSMGPGVKIDAPATVSAVSTAKK